MITTTYHSPLGDIVLVADARGLRGLWFDGDSRSASEVPSDAAFLDMHHPAVSEMVDGRDAVSGEGPMSTADPCNAAAVGVLERTWAWLNAYFAGRPPLWIPPLHLDGSELDHAVSVALLEIPFGAKATAGVVAERVAALSALANPDREGKRAFRQMVEGSIARNPVSIVIPAHRVDPDVEHMAGHALDLRAFESDAVSCPGE